MNDKLIPKTDSRGTLYEVFKIPNCGQVFCSTSKPGVTRGNHYHTRKIERFCVLSGNAELVLKDRKSGEILKYNLDGKYPEVIEIPVDTVHKISNIGEVEMLLLSFVNEIFDANDPDTFSETIV